MKLLPHSFVLWSMAALSVLLCHPGNTALASKVEDGENANITEEDINLESLFENILLEQYPDDYVVLTPVVNRHAEQTTSAPTTSAPNIEEPYFINELTMHEITNRSNQVSSDDYRDKEVSTTVFVKLTENVPPMELTESEIALTTGISTEATNNGETKIIKEQGEYTKKSTSPSEFQKPTTIAHSQIDIHPTSLVHPNFAIQVSENGSKTQVSVVKVNLVKPVFNTGTVNDGKIITSLPSLKMTSPLKIRDITASKTTSEPSTTKIVMNKESLGTTFNVRTHSSQLRKKQPSKSSQASVKWTNTVRFHPTQPYQQPQFVYTQPTPRRTKMSTSEYRIATRPKLSETSTTTKVPRPTQPQVPKLLVTEEDGFYTSTLRVGTNKRIRSNYHAKPYFELSKMKHTQAENDKPERSRPNTSTSDDLQTYEPTTQASISEGYNETTTEILLDFQTEMEQHHRIPAKNEVPSTPNLLPHPTPTPRPAPERGQNSIKSTTPSFIPSHHQLFHQSTKSAPKFVNNIFTGRLSYSHPTVMDNVKATEPTEFYHPTSRETFPQTPRTVTPKITKMKKGSHERLKNYATSYVIPNNTLRKFL
ncbi:proteoglycan 4 [Hyalella azteca]|uniref:Proteoglycan 4 n=1 Tax=Hyalella azteca TaxID=294128 RepID=A0A8B7N8I9_HYAAZ|nr:proteoglycan 4 [Hyalella azteca]